MQLLARAWSAVHIVIVWSLFCGFVSSDLHQKSHYENSIVNCCALHQKYLKMLTITFLDEVLLGLRKLGLIYMANTQSRLV